jgi:hypothetical protein
LHRGHRNPLKVGGPIKLGKLTSGELGQFSLNFQPLKRASLLGPGRRVTCFGNLIPGAFLLYKKSEWLFSKGNFTVLKTYVPFTYQFR